MGIGVITMLVALIMWMGYFTAKHHFSAEAKLISVDVKEQTRLKDQNDPNYLTIPKMTGMRPIIPIS